MKRLIGTWLLLSYKLESFDGIVFYPMGKDALGQLIYTAQGFFSMIIMKQNRRNFISDNLFEGTVEEKLAAADGFIAYGGRFMVDGSKVTHSIEMSFFPNWVGKSQSCPFVFANDTFSMSAVSLTTTTNAPEIAHIVWKRAPSMET